MNLRTAPSLRARGFSLVEVVLAIGIVSFALLTLLGLFGGSMQSANQNTERRELAEAIDGLRRTFQTTNFATSYDWVRTQKKLLYVSYRADENGNPDANASGTAALWLDPNAPPKPLSDYEAARTGRWVRASLRVSPSNPAGTNLPATASGYPQAVVFGLITLDALATPSVSAPTNSSILEATLAIPR